MSIALSSWRLAIGSLLLGLASAASAQATRTWVSGVGDDANPCSRTAPCRSFAGAISKTAARGEINVLDPGGFGAVTITKSISIISPFGWGGILAAGTNGITVNVTPTDKVVLDGLDIEGAGTGINGIRIIGGGITVIRRSSIRNFTEDGVHLVGTVSGTRVAIVDSDISFSGGGLFVQGVGNVVNNAIIERTVFDQLVSYHVQIAGPGTVTISASQLIGGSAPKLVASGGGAISSFGNNVILGTIGATPTVLPLR